MSLKDEVIFLLDNIYNKYLNNELKIDNNYLYFKAVQEANFSLMIKDDFLSIDKILILSTIQDNIKLIINYNHGPSMVNEDYEKGFYSQVNDSLYIAIDEEMIEYY